MESFRKKCQERDRDLGLPLDLGIGMFILIYGLFFFAQAHTLRTLSRTSDAGKCRSPRLGLVVVALVWLRRVIIQMGNLCLISRGTDLRFSEAMLCQLLAMFCMFVRAYGII